jgi:hypothetical protein
MSWVVQPYEFDLADSPIFFLAATYDGRLARGFTCHYFNISSWPVSEDPPSGEATDAPPAPSSSPSSAAEAEDAADDRAYTLKLALGIGLGIGVPLLILCGFVVGLLPLRRSRRQSLHPPSSPSPSPSPASLGAQKESIITTTASATTTRTKPGVRNAPLRFFYPGGGPYGSATTPAELSPTGFRLELHQTPMPRERAELDGRSRPTEMDCVAGEG